VLQWHYTSDSGPPPLALQVTQGRLMMVCGGDDMRAVGPVRPGETVDLALHIVFSQDPDTSSVTVLRDGRPTGVTDWKPRRGTMITEEASLKMGLYRDPDIDRPVRLTVTDLRIGRPQASLGDLLTSALGALEPGGAGPSGVTP
jgi:hypothetical protein